MTSSNVFRDHTKDNRRYTNRVWQDAVFMAMKTMSYTDAKKVADAAYAAAQDDQKPVANVRRMAVQK